MRRVESLMGTTISLELAGAVPMAKARSAADGVFAWLREVDDRFSTFKADSEVSRFAGDLGVASTWLREVLERCAAAVDGDRRLLRRVRDRAAGSFRIRQGVGRPGRIGPADDDRAD